MGLFVAETLLITKSSDIFAKDFVACRVELTGNTCYNNIKVSIIMIEKIAIRLKKDLSLSWIITMFITCQNT